MKARFVVPFVMAIIFSFNSLAYSATVVKDGKEWLQLTDSLGVTYATMAGYCSVGTGVCTSGAIGSTSLADGWVWADYNDIASLFDAYIGSEFVYDVSTTLQPYKKRVQDSAFAVEFFQDFTPTIMSGGISYAYGTTRSLTITDRIFMATMEERLPGTNDYAYIEGWHHVSYGNIGSALVGQWIYRDVSAVPVPAAAFMFAPALLGFLGLRRKARA